MRPLRPAGPAGARRGRRRAAVLLRRVPHRLVGDPRARVGALLRRARRVGRPAPAGPRLRAQLRGIRRPLVPGALRATPAGRPDGDRAVPRRGPLRRVRLARRTRAARRGRSGRGPAGLRPLARAGHLGSRRGAAVARSRGARRAGLPAAPLPRGEGPRHGPAGRPRDAAADRRGGGARHEHHGACLCALRRDPPRDGAGVPRAVPLGEPAAGGPGGALPRRRLPEGGLGGAPHAYAAHGRTDQPRHPRGVRDRDAEHDPRHRRRLLRVADRADLPAARRALPADAPAARRRRRDRAAGVALAVDRAPGRARRRARGAARGAASGDAGRGPRRRYRAGRRRRARRRERAGPVAAHRRVAPGACRRGGPRPRRDGQPDRAAGGRGRVDRRGDPRRPPDAAGRGARAAPRADRAARRPDLGLVRGRGAGAGGSDRADLVADRPGARGRQRRRAADRHLSLRTGSGDTAGCQRRRSAAPRGLAS